MALKLHFRESRYFEKDAIFHKGVYLNFKEDILYDGKFENIIHYKLGSKVEFSDVWISNLNKRNLKF